MIWSICRYHPGAAPDGGGRRRGPAARQAGGGNAPTSRKFCARCGKPGAIPGVRRGRRRLAVGNRRGLSVHHGHRPRAARRRGWDGPDRIAAMGDAGRRSPGPDMGPLSRHARCAREPSGISSSPMPAERPPVPCQHQRPSALRAQRSVHRLSWDGARHHRRNRREGAGGADHRPARRRAADPVELHRRRRSQAGVRADAGDAAGGHAERLWLCRGDQPRRWRRPISRRTPSPTSRGTRKPGASTRRIPPRGWNFSI